MNTFPPFVIFSAERNDLSAEANRDRTELLAGALTNRGIVWESAQGTYNGHKEASFLVFAYEGSEVADQIEALARHYAQESVLYVDAQHLAYLLMLNEGRAVELGSWKEISAHEARSIPAHTKVGELYYATSV